MERSHSDKVRSYIDLVDLLLPLELDLPLPAIAVIGDQSSGKRSVLEALSGVALPRGEKYTLHLKMNKTKGNKWYGIFKYRTYSNSSFKEKVILHCKDVAETINQVKPWNYLYSGTFILEIISPDVPDLTLVALPGIPSMANNTQETRDEVKLKQQIYEIISNPECIILMVVPCNVDITTTGALNMAKQVDPDGERTLGLLTKPDLVEKDKEKEIVDIAQNKVTNLKKGFMIVRCYDQTKMFVMHPIEKERNFFKDHAHFKSFYDSGFATFSKLGERLTKELVEHIEKYLPQLKEYVKSELVQANAALKRLGNTPPSDEADRQTFLTDKCTAFTQDIMRLTTGNLLDLTDERVFSVWRKIVKDSDESVQCKLEAEVTLHEQSGFSNSETVEQVIKDQIKLLEEPAVLTLNNFAEIVSNELLKLVEKNFFGYPNLISKAERAISNLISQKQKAAELLLRTQFKMEQFEVQAEARICSKKRREKKRDTAPQLYSYYQTICQRLASHIPMMIRFHMFNESSTELQKEIMCILNIPNNSCMFNCEKKLTLLRDKTQRSFIPLTKAQIMLLEL